MPIKLSVERHPQYLRFELTGKRVTGEFGQEMLKIWTRLADEFAAAGVTRMLGVSDLIGPARVADIYASAVAGFEMLQRSNCRKVAIAVLGGFAAVEQNRLAEDMASSRGVAVRIFASEPEALAWLLEE